MLITMTDATAATMTPGGVIQGRLAGRPSDGEQERRVIAELWDMLAVLLSGGVGSVVASIRSMTASLPAVEGIEQDQAPQLAQLHLRSAGGLMHAIRLLAPTAFNTDSSTSLNPAGLLSLEGDRLQLVTCLIELQLFHVRRAAALVAHAREHLHGCSELTVA